MRIQKASCLLSLPLALQGHIILLLAFGFCLNSSASFRETWSCKLSLLPRGMDRRYPLRVRTAYHKTSVLALQIRSILAHWRSSAVYGDPDPSHWVAPFQSTRIRGSSEAIIHAAIFGRKGATDVLGKRHM